MVIISLREDVSRVCRSYAPFLAERSPGHHRNMKEPVHENLLWSGRGRAWLMGIPTMSWTGRVLKLPILSRQSSNYTAHGAPP